jgi:predicted secreted protein
MKIYKCYYDDGSYCLKFSDDGRTFYQYSDGYGLGSYLDNYSKIEPLETGANRSTRPRNWKYLSWLRS